MGKGRSEKVSDEFATIFREISNTSSSNPYSGVHAPSKVMPLYGSLLLENLDLRDSPVNTTNGHLGNKMDGRECFNPGNRVAQNRIQQSSIAEEPNLPDGQSLLTSAFAEFSLCNDMTRMEEAANAETIKSELAYDQWSLLGAENPSAVPCLKENDKCTSHMVNLEPQEQTTHHHGSCSPYRSLPFPQGGLQVSHVPLNLAASGVELQLPMIPSHNHRHLHGNHQQAAGQPEMAWRQFLEHERNCRMIEQYIHIQEIQNQLLEARRSRCQANRTSTTSAAFGANQWVEKLGKHKHTVPQKILLRSHEMNSLKSNNLGFSDQGYQFNSETNHRRRGFSNGHQLVDSTGLVHDSLWSRLDRHDSLEELSGRMHLFAKDQYGCLFLQRKIAEGTTEDVSKIFDGVVDHIVDLLMDPFGNYLIQMLLEVCTDDQRILILAAITRKPGDLVRISCDTHGTRAIQKIIEIVMTPEQSALIVSSLKPGVMTLMKNINGNHVTQRCLQQLKPEYKEFLFEAAISNFLELATDRHGCSLLQKCLSQSDGENRRLLVSKTTTNALILSQDPYGYGLIPFFPFGVFHPLMVPSFI
ncbi:hypothetical protein Dimus_021354 [Dionaea muscipula]